MSWEPERLGRRPGAAGDRCESILEAARKTFLANGSNATSIRAVALEASLEAFIFILWSTAFVALELGVSYGSRG